MATAPADLHREAARLNDLLGKVGYPDGHGPAWWNTSHPDLNGDTPTQVWLAGHHDRVIALVNAYIAECFEAKLGPNAEILSRIPGAPSLEELWTRRSVREELADRPKRPA